MRIPMRLAAIVPLLAGLAGCGGDPPVYPVTGKVTLGGKPYERLLVYFRPVEGPVTLFNMGVGETDKNGNLTLRSSGGSGIAAGEYKVSFACLSMKTSNRIVGPDEKPDENGGASVVVERVPAPYDDATSRETTPVRFTVGSGENIFSYDIPAK